MKNNKPTPFNYNPDNESLGTETSTPCACCGRPVESATATHAVHVVNGGSNYGDSSDTDDNDLGDMGWFNVGPSCAKKLMKAGVYVGIIDQTGNIK